MRPLDRVAQSKGSVGASLVIRSPALQFQDLQVFLLSVLGRTPLIALIEEGARLSEDIYVLAEGLLPFLGFLSSSLPEPLPRVCFF